MNRIARLIVTALIAALAFVAVAATAQADSHPGSPGACDPLTSQPGACDPGTPPAECDPLTSQPGACDAGETTTDCPPPLDPPGTSVTTVGSPGAESALADARMVVARHDAQIARLQAKVQQLRDRLRSR